jgi:hypothetical protein
MAEPVRYRFRSVWTADAAPATCYAVLYDFAAYPAWWKEVRAAQQLDDGFFDVRCRSFLPYDLRFTARRKIADPELGILEMVLEGDLEGYSRWTISGASGPTNLLFDEEVVTNKALLNRLAPVARPGFVLNHRIMMRNGQRGLRTYLAGFLAGRENDPAATG